MSKPNESMEDYQERMNELALRVGKTIEGENLDEVVLVLTRMLVFIFEEMAKIDKKRRNAMIMLMMEYFDASDINLGDTH